MKHHWNKGPAIWFPSRAGLAAKHTSAARRPALFAYRSGTGCTWRSLGYERARDPRQGGLGVECEKAKRDGGSRRFQALEEVPSFREGRAQAALQRSWAGLAV